jgi:hypothetical protein
MEVEDGWVMVNLDDNAAGGPHPQVDGWGDMEIDSGEPLPELARH